MLQSAPVNTPHLPITQHISGHEASITCRMPADKDLVKRKKARKQLGTACTPTKLTQAGNRNHTLQLEPRSTMRTATFTEIHCFSTGPCCSKQTVQISLPTLTNKTVKPSLPYQTLHRHFGFCLVKLCTMNT